MNYRAILSHIRAEPFPPFRIHMASGRTFDVRHPEMIRVGRSFVLVFAYSHDEDRLIEHVEPLGLPLIESLELLDTPVTQD